MNKTDKARLTAIIRFIIKRRKAPDSMRIVEIAIGLASFFQHKKKLFLPVTSEANKNRVAENNAWQTPGYDVDTKFA